MPEASPQATPHAMRGVLAPVITPFQSDLSIDIGRLTAHCEWLIAQDCGLAIFGTNSEGNSLSVAEKIDTMDALVAAGLPPERMMPGTGACALPDAVALARHAARLGCGGVLALPPFYYKAVSDDGIFAFFDRLIEGVGEAALRIYLYHIPPVAQVGFSQALIARLIAAHPEVVVGIKDSSGDLSHCRGLLERFPGFSVFPGNEMFLRETMALGATGTISAIANVNPAGIDAVYRGWDGADGEALQARANAIRAIFARHNTISAMKAAMAAARQDPGWRRVRPPLEALGAEAEAELLAALAEAGFSID